MSVREWWDERTADVEGVHKLIGEPHSMWRQGVIWPLGILVVMVLGILYELRRDHR